MRIFFLRVPEANIEIYTIGINRWVRRNLYHRYRNIYRPISSVKEISNTMCEVELGHKNLAFNYNRVSKFVPWDEFNLTTTTWNTSLIPTIGKSMTETQLSRNNEEILEGDIILFQLKNDTHSSQQKDNSNYAVGKVANINEGWINFQWMGNYNDKSAPYKPGWIDNQNKEYYNSSKLHTSHKVFDNESTQTYIRSKNVLYHGAKVLKSDGRLTKEAKDVMKP